MPVGQKWMNADVIQGPISKLDSSDVFQHLESSPGMQEVDSLLHASNDILALVNVS